MAMCANDDIFSLSIRVQRRIGVIDYGPRFHKFSQALHINIGVVGSPTTTGVDEDYYIRKDFGVNERVLGENVIVFDDLEDRVRQPLCGEGRSAHRCYLETLKEI